MFRFEHVEMLYLLAVVPVIILLYMAYNLRRKKDLKRFGDADLLKELAPDASNSKPTLKFYISMIILTFLILVLARPQFGLNKKEVERKGIELIVALDVSNSMNAKDMSGTSNDTLGLSRLDVAKQVVTRVINKMSNDKIGLIVFAGDAYIQVPLTTDHISAKMFLSNISTASVPRQGTAIGKAINLALQSFGPKEEKGRAILVITDGENHEGDALGAAKEALKKGVTVYTLGLGTQKGVPIPILGTNSYMKDRSGQIVMTMADSKMLTEIAQAGGGAYIQGSNNTTQTVRALESYTDKIDKKDMKATVYENYEEYFQLMAAIALLMMLLDLFILRGKSPLFKNVHLFK